jgi:hypothetical protein
MNDELESHLWFTISQACEESCFSRDVILRHVKDGTLKSTMGILGNKEKKQRCVNYDSLVELINQLPCQACGMKRNYDEPDPCIGYLPGVINACCGHGFRDGYVQFSTETVISGRFTQISYGKRPKPLRPFQLREERKSAEGTDAGVS